MRSSDSTTAGSSLKRMFKSEQSDAGPSCREELPRRAFISNDEIRNGVTQGLAARLAPAEQRAPQETMAQAAPEPSSESLVLPGPAGVPASQVLVPRIEIALGPPTRPGRTL